jgi:ABC-type Fe3+/spermidine/putrescine transport system ATPase subunit
MVVRSEHGFDIEVMFEEGLTKGAEVIVSVRPEAIAVNPQNDVPKGMNCIDAVIKQATYLGDIVRYEAETPWGITIKADSYNPRHAQIFDEKEKVSLTFRREDTKIIGL